MQPTGVHPAPALGGAAAIQRNAGRKAIKILSASLRILNISILKVSMKKLSLILWFCQRLARLPQLKGGCIAMVSLHEKTNISQREFCTNYRKNCNSYTITLSPGEFCHLEIHALNCSTACAREPKRPIAAEKSSFFAKTSICSKI